MHSVVRAQAQQDARGQDNSGLLPQLDTGRFASRFPTTASEKVRWPSNCSARLRAAEMRRFFHLEWDRKGYFEIFHLILERSVPPNAPLRNGATILHEIVTTGYHVTDKGRLAFASAALDAGARRRRSPGSS